MPLFDNHYSFSEQGFAPNYDLDQYLDSQFSVTDKAKLINFLRHLVLQKKPCRLVVEAIDENYYAGQRGFFYFINEALNLCNGFNTIMSPFEIGVFNVDYNIDENGDFSRQTSYGLETLVLKTKLRLTPETMMNTDYFINMVRRLAIDLADLIS